MAHDSLRNQSVCEVRHKRRGASIDVCEMLHTSPGSAALQCVCWFSVSHTGYCWLAFLDSIAFLEFATRRRGERMQIHQIRYFLALCEERSFTRAARRSGVSQPSLTNAIAVLEKELGGALFNRRPAVALTALGNAVFPHFERIGEHAKHAAEVARVLTHSRATQSDASVPNQSEPRHDAASPRPAELPGY